MQCVRGCYVPVLWNPPLTTYECCTTAVRVLSRQSSIRNTACIYGDGRAVTFGSVFCTGMSLSSGRDAPLFLSPRVALDPSSRLSPACMCSVWVWGRFGVSNKMHADSTYYCGIGATATTTLLLWCACVLLQCCTRTYHSLLRTSYEYCTLYCSNTTVSSTWTDAFGTALRCTLTNSAITPEYYH